MAVIKTSSTLSTFITLLFLLMLLALSGCFSVESPPTEEPVVLESQNLDVFSAHASGVCTSTACEGENCASANCHREDADNIVFPLSGTVFDYQDLNSPLVNSTATIEFYSKVAGGGELLKSLGVDAYGNFYSTEPITTNAFPALRYQDGLGNTRVVYMPRPVAPTVPGSCNFCHQIAIPPTVFENLSEFDDPKYLRISTGVVSSAGADTNYHLSIVPGPNCLDGACHGSPGTATLFTMAGAVQQTETGDLYTLADAALGLFPEECDDQRYNCQSGATDPVLRTKTPKLFIGINSLGHFYTTQPIDWTLPTYPTLANYDANNACRNIKHMLSAVPQADAGNCYSCHDGATQPPITIMGILDPKNPVEKCAPPPPELPESG